MRAVVHKRYGDPATVVSVEDVPRPAPGPGEVLVRVHAASLHPDVWHVVTGRPRILRIIGGGLLRPRHPVLGIDLAGVVEATGDGADRFRPGDEVLGECSQGFQWRSAGTFAEYAAVPESSLEPKPSNVSMVQAAAAPTSGVIAVQGVRDQAHLVAGERILVNGAGGGVGSLSVMLAKAWGAHVTAVDAADKADMLRRTGADDVIDYRTTDFTRTGERYDVLLDIPGNRPWRHLRRAVKPGGRYVLIGHDAYGARGHRILGSVGRFASLALRSLWVPELRSVRVVDDAEDRLAVVTRLMAEEKVTPFVDRTFRLEEFHQALAYLASGRVRGKIVLTL